MCLIKNLTLVVLALAAVGESALRVRYCDPAQVNPDPGYHNKVKNSGDEWWIAKIEPGVWDGWTAQNGFDNAGEKDLGKFDNAPYSHTSFWVDSILEDRSDMPFIQNSEEVLNGEGVFVLLYGDIQVPSSGDWTFYGSASDEGLYTWLDFNGDGEIAKDGKSYPGNKYYGSSEELTGRGISKTSVSNSLWPTAQVAGDWNSCRVKKATLQTGKRYKFMAFQWDHSQICLAGLFWQKGNGSIVPVPSSAFGKRKQMGPPMAKMTKVVADGVEYTAEANPMISLASCKTVTFHAEALNMLGQSPTFIWTFEDGKTVTGTSNTITHQYQSSGFKFPNVKVKRGDRTSLQSPETFMINVSSAAACGTTMISMNRLFQAQGFFRDRHRIFIRNATYQPISLEISNLLGGKVATVKTTNQDGVAVADLSDHYLSKGSYMIHVYGGGIKYQSLPLVIGK